MRILFADSFPQSVLGSDFPHAVTVAPDLTGETLPAAIGDAQVLVVRSTKVTAETLEAAPDLELVIRAGAGTNTIDKQAAADRGIYVCNVPGKNAIAVAELAMGLIMSLDRRIPDNVADLRAGSWNKKIYSQADGLAGKTMAVVGLGEIGTALAERASSFRIRVLAAEKAGRPLSAVVRAQRCGVEFVPDDATLLSDADIVSLHVPLNDETLGLVNADFLGMCKDGAWIINTSRGEIVDEPALIDALDNRGMRAGLDVFADEPSASAGAFVSPLAQHPSVYGTHHIGASTEQAQQAIAEQVVEIIADFAHGEIRNCVNLERHPLGTCTLTVRHLDRVGVLSEVLGVLQRADVNVEQMNNEIFSGATAAVATIRTSCAIPDDVADQLQRVNHVLGVSVQAEE